MAILLSIASSQDYLQVDKIRCYLLLQDSLVSAHFWILVALGRHSEGQDGRLKFDSYSLLKLPHS